MSLVASSSCLCKLPLHVDHEPGARVGFGIKVANKVSVSSYDAGLPIMHSNFQHPLIASTGSSHWLTGDGGSKDCLLLYIPVHCCSHSLKCKMEVFLDRNLVFHGIIFATPETTFHIEGEALAIARAAGLAPSYQKGMRSRLWCCFAL